MPFTRPAVSRSHCDPVLFFRWSHSPEGYYYYYYFRKFARLMLIISFADGITLPLFFSTQSFLFWYSNAYIYRFRLRTNSFFQHLPASFYFLRPERYRCSYILPTYCRDGIRFITALYRLLLCMCFHNSITENSSQVLLFLKIKQK